VKHKQRDTHTNRSLVLFRHKSTASEICGGGRRICEEEEEDFPSLPKHVHKEQEE
jgi:hypothetical protein